MKAEPIDLAAFSQTSPGEVLLSGHWTARGLSAVVKQTASAPAQPTADIVADASGVEALDTAGAWVLQKLLLRLRSEGSTVTLKGMRPQFAKLMTVMASQVDKPTPLPVPALNPPYFSLTSIGRFTGTASERLLLLLGFVGENAIVLGGWVARPTRIRLRPILYNIRSAGFDALPIVGLLSFLLGIVVAYQGADQLRQYGANIYVADLVGLSMLREFAPLITAIIVAGRSGSAYAAQIGTMAVTEEIDALRTLGIAPLDVLVLPKIIALLIALPLLTAFADVLGVMGGMLMARAQLGIGFNEFLDRFAKAVSMSSYLVGIGKAPMFAAIIATVGCFQGFRTQGGAESVGRQTTRSVVQSIFLVIVADAFFSVVFSAMGL